MISPEQNNVRDQARQIGRTEIADKAVPQIWISPQTQKIGIAKSINLNTGEEKGVDSTLRCAIEEFATAIREIIVGLRAQDRHAHCWPVLLG